MFFFLDTDNAARYNAIHISHGDDEDAHVKMSCNSVLYDTTWGQQKIHEI